MIFVTGGTGLLGKYLLKELTEKPCSILASKRDSSKTEEVFTFLKKTTSNPLERWKCIEWIDCDLTDVLLLEDIIKKTNTVYHCAAEVSFNKSDKKKLFHSNVVATANLVNCCLIKKEIKFCFVCSTGVFGQSSDDELINENTQTVLSAKSSFYSRTKKWAELEVLRGIAEGLDAIIVYPSIILGWDSIRSSSGLFHIIKKGLRFYPPGSHGFVYAEDVAKQMILLLENNSGFKQFILNAENISYQSLFYDISTCMGMKPPKYKANAFILHVARIADIMYSFIIGKRHTLTKESLRASTGNYKFDGSLCSTITAHQYTTLKKAIIDICELIK